MSSGSSTIAEAAALLLQTPPGQTSKVYHDLRALLESGGASNVSVELKKAAAPVLEQYNTEQLITVKPQQAAASGLTEAGQAADRPIIISRAAEVPGRAGRYADPRAKLSYAFDHLRLVSSICLGISLTRSCCHTSAAHTHLTLPPCPPCPHPPSARLPRRRHKVRERSQAIAGEQDL